MQAHGADRLRNAGGKIILDSPIPKGWVARKPKGVHAEYPGTAVMWDDAYFEVVSAGPGAEGGVRYVLEPWRDEHIMRSFQHYDAASEAQRIADHRAAAAQRKKSVLGRLSGMFLGHFPQHVQDHLQNELGLTPTRMTMLSCVPSVLLLGGCVWLYSDARLTRTASPVPFWLWAIAVYLVIDSAVRFLVAMSHGRGIGSLFGTIGYIAFWYALPTRRKWPSPFDPGRGHKLFMLPPPDDVALQDALQIRGPWFTLLTAEEQKRLSTRYGFDHRKHAYGLAWLILVFATLGAVSSFVKVSDGGGGFGPLVSLIVAGGLAVEQIVRLGAFKRGPAGCFLGILARPFLRRFLENG